MSLKKILCAISMMFVAGTVAHAQVVKDISAGINVGGGIPFIRYSDGSTWEDSFYDSRTSFQVQATVLVEFAALPFLALETGFGFSYAGLTWDNAGEDPFGWGYYNADNGWLERKQVYIPIMVRAQHGYGVGNMYMVSYFSIGLKLGIPIGDFMYHDVDYYDYYDSSYDYSYALTLPKSSFALDIPIAVGQEIQFGESHYVGLRIQYDINVVAGHAFDMYGEWENSWGGKIYEYTDSLNFSLTYRYSFASTLWG